MKHRILIAACAVCLASAAFSHSGVKNAAVMARMHMMGAIGDQMKTLGQMAKGAVPFDKTAAQSAAAEIARHAAATPELFKAPEEDPKSEAKPNIWTDFADFTAKSDALNTVAMGWSTGLNTADDLGPALKSLGAACKACHKVYRE